MVKQKQSVFACSQQAVSAGMAVSVRAGGINLSMSPQVGRSQDEWGGGGGSASAKVCNLVFILCSVSGGFTCLAVILAIHSP